MNDAVLQCVSNSATNVGCTRELNEDAYFDCSRKRLWAVADGMGGHSAGDFASRTIVAALADVEPATHLGSYVERIKQCINEVHSQLNTEAERRDGTTIGTTVAVLIAGARHCVYLWAGDSRIYLYRDRKLHQLTRDHSVLQELLDQGIAPGPHEPQVHADANQITRAVGGNVDLALDAEMIEMRSGDVYLLCSDGLNKELADEEIGALLRKHDNASADHLIDMALAHGARDNVTVVAVAWVSG